MKSVLIQPFGSPKRSPTRDIASRIAEELAASAESRGISNPCPHTCRREIVFGYADGLACVLAFALSLAYFVFEWTVIR